MLKSNNRGLFVGFLMITAGFFFLPAITLAKTSEDPGPEFSGVYWIWALLSLIIVVALAYWATKFLAGKFGVSQARHIKVAESLFIGPNRHLYLLLFHKKVLLVASSEHGLNLIQEIDDPGLYAELEQASATSQQVIPTGKFAAFLGPFFNGLNPKQIGEYNNSDSKQRLQEGLAKIRAWRMRGKDHQ